VEWQRLADEQAERMARRGQGETSEGAAGQLAELAQINEELSSSVHNLAFLASQFLVRFHAKVVVELEAGPLGPKLR